MDVMLGFKLLKNLFPLEGVDSVDSGAGGVDDDFLENIPAQRFRKDGLEDDFLEKIPANRFRTDGFEGDSGVGDSGVGDSEDGFFRNNPENRLRRDDPENRLRQDDSTDEFGVDDFDGGFFGSNPQSDLHGFGSGRPVVNVLGAEPNTLLYALL